MKDILSKNRVLEWLSNPEGVEHDISSFLRIDKSAKRMNSGKTAYSRLEIVIPKDGTIKRNIDNSIEIISSLFSIRISIDYSGFSGGIPSEFYTRYRA